MVIGLGMAGGRSAGAPGLIDKTPRLIEPLLLPTCPRRQVLLPAGLAQLVHDLPLASGGQELLATIRLAALTIAQADFLGQGLLPRMSGMQAVVDQQAAVFEPTGVGARPAGRFVVESAIGVEDSLLADGGSLAASQSAPRLLLGGATQLQETLQGEVKGSHGVFGSPLRQYRRRLEGQRRAPEHAGPGC